MSEPLSRRAVIVAFRLKGSSRTTFASAGPSLSSLLSQQQLQFWSLSLCKIVSRRGEATGPSGCDQRSWYRVGGAG